MSNTTHSHNDHLHNHHEQQRPQQRQRRQHPRAHRTHRSGPLEWAAAVVFMVLAILVLVGALAVLLVALVLQPKPPYVAVRSARLDSLVYDQQGVLEAEHSLGVVAENGNARTNVSFSDLELRLSFHGMVIAILRADPFDVPRKGELPLEYVARSSGIPLDDARRAAMEAALNDGVVPFSVAGQARAHWKFGALVAVKYWSRLRCELRFFWPNGTALDFSCKSKFRY